MNSVSTTRLSPRDIEILRARARTLAQPSAGNRPEGELIEILEFRLAQEAYAIETRYVREVRVLANLTPLPCVPRFMLGIVSVRGQVLPVIDCRKFLGLTGKGIEDLHSMIIVDDGDLTIGLAADAIVGILTIPIANIRTAAAATTGIPSEYVMGMTSQRLLLLNAHQILGDPKLCIKDEPSG